MIAENRFQFRGLPEPSIRNSLSLHDQVADRSFATTGQRPWVRYPGSILPVCLEHHGYPLYRDVAANEKESPGPTLVRGFSISHHLTEQGIANQIYYPIALHLQKAYAHLGGKRGDLPVCDQVQDTVFSLPMYPELTDEQIKVVTDAVKKAV